MLISQGSLQFFPTGDPEETSILTTSIRQLQEAVIGAVPCPWKKILLCFETSLNVQSVNMIFLAESGALYTDDDLVSHFSMAEDHYDSWFDRLHELCETIHSSYWNLTGESWQQLILILLPDQEPALRLIPTDWCDVNWKVKQMLLRKQEFGATIPEDADLMQAYEDFMARRGAHITQEDMENRSEPYRDLMELFRPHRFTPEMTEQTGVMLKKHFARYNLTCTEEQLRQMAQGLLYAFEAEDEYLTEEIIQSISYAEYRSSLSEQEARRYEYYFLPEL